MLLWSKLKVMFEVLLVGELLKRSEYQKKNKGGGEGEGERERREQGRNKKNRSVWG